MDTSMVACVSYMQYHYLIINYMNPLALQFISWQVKILVLRYRLQLILLVERVFNVRAGLSLQLLAASLMLFRKVGARFHYDRYIHGSEVTQTLLSFWEDLPYTTTDVFPRLASSRDVPGSVRSCYAIKIVYVSSRPIYSHKPRRISY
jgi:hypothetical protein